MRRLAATPIEWADRKTIINTTPLHFRPANCHIECRPAPRDPSTDTPAPLNLQIHPSPPIPSDSTTSHDTNSPLSHIPHPTSPHPSQHNTAPGAHTQSHHLQPSQPSSGRPILELQPATNRADFAPCAVSAGAVGFRPSQSGRIGEEGVRSCLEDWGCWTGLSTVAKAMVGRELVVRERGHGTEMWLFVGQERRD